MIHDKKQLYIVHTYGLGDSVMLLNALDTLSNKDKFNFSVLTNERIVYEYLKLKNIQAHFLSLSKIVKYVIYSKIFSHDVSVMRSFGGTSFKNYLLGFLFKLFRIAYEWKVSESVGPIPFSVRSSKNVSLLKRFFDITEKDLIHKAFPVFLGVNATRHMLADDKYTSVLIHFGAGDSLQKSLSSKLKKSIVDYYEKLQSVDRVYLLKGPRDEHFIVEPSSKIKFLGSEDPFSLKDLIELSKNVDLCVCNDTGIGHLMSYEGVKVDLWVNGDSLSLIHQVLPNNVSSLTIV